MKKLTKLLIGEPVDFEADVHQHWCISRDGGECNCDSGYTKDQMDKLVGRIRDALAIVGVFVVIILIGLL